MNDFLNPDNKYRGTDFFMLNDTLTEEDLRFQISEMACKGVASFIARTYIGLKSDYPGPDFMSKMRVMIDEAKKHGMTVFVQAGYMPEAVLDLPESFALEYLCVNSDGKIPEGERFVSEKDGCVYSAKSSVTCLNLFDSDSVAFYIHQSYDLWQPFKSDFGKTITSIWVDEPSYHSEHLPWFKSFDKIFFDCYGYDIKQNIYKLYNDIDDFKRVRYHYWTLLQKQLEKCYFSMIRDWCRENGIMFSGHLMMEDTLFSQIKRACAVMPYYKYFDIPGLDILRGYMNWNNDPIIDLEGTEFFTEHMYTTPMQTVSAAHQAGKELILCEMYGVTTNGMGFRDFEYYFDHFASMGVNHRSVHGLFYSLHGRSKRMYPPQVNYYQPYWYKYKLVTDYCARTSSFISNGKPFAKTLVLHPLETAYCYYRGSDREPLPTNEMDRLDKQFSMLLRTLFSNHISYELGDLNTISSGYGKIDEESRKFVVGCMEYDTVVIPYIEILDKKTADLLKQFADIGGNVFVLGDYPFMLDGEMFDVRSSYLSKACLVNDLSQLVQELLQLGDYYTLESDKNACNIRVYHTQNGGELYYMLFNDNCREQHNATLGVYGNYKASICDADTGKEIEQATSYDGTKTSVYVTLSEGRSVLIRLTRCCDPVRDITDSAVTSKVIALSNKYNTKRLHDNVLLMEFCEFKTEQMDSFEGPYTVLAVNRLLTDQNYRGQLIQRFRFVSGKSVDNLSLALEDAEKCEVYLNGRKSNAFDGKSFYFAKSFEKVKLSGACLVGENVIEIVRDFVPLSKFRSSITSLFESQLGVELESMYLLGDFGVYSTVEPTLNGSLRYNKNCFLDDEKAIINGELTKDGFVFFTGSVELSKDFNVDFSVNRKYMLKIDDFHGCVAEIFVNGIFCGDIYKAPYATEITQALQNGNNKLTVKLTNTLRPILGPYHRPRGEVGECWGGYGDPDLSWTGSKNGKDWYKNSSVDSKVWTDSYNQVRFGISDIKIIELM